MPQQRTSRAKTADAPTDPIWKELNDLKRLFLLQLVRDGASQQQLADALGVAQSTVSRMLPKSPPASKSVATKTSKGR